MTLFGKIVKKVLSEGKNDKGVIKYEDLKNDYVKGPFYVYHMTNKANLKGAILKSGFESYFNSVNSYGPGIYACLLPSFDPAAKVTYGGYGTKQNPNLDAERQQIYGRKDNKSGGQNKVDAVMILCKTLNPYPLRNFVIFDENLAKMIYRHHWKPLDQLKLILGRDVFQEKMATNSYLRQLGAYSDSANKFWQAKKEGIKNNEIPSKYIEGYDALYYRGFGATKMDRACEDFDINKAVKGLVFHGPGDGYVIIFRDYNAVKPVAISNDLGHTFTPIDTEAEFDDYTSNNIDIRSKLGVDRYFNSKTNKIRRQFKGYDRLPFSYISDTFYGDYAVVKKDIQGQEKSNYIYKPFLLKNPDDYRFLLVSKHIWFDNVAENDWDNGQTFVRKNGIWYSIKNDNNHFYLYDEDNNLIGDLLTLTDNDLAKYNQDKAQMAQQQPNNNNDFDIDNLGIDFNF